MWVLVFEARRKWSLTTMNAKRICASFDITTIVQIQIIFKFFSYSFQISLLYYDYCIQYQRRARRSDWFCLNSRSLFNTLAKVPSPHRAKAHRQTDFGKFETGQLADNDPPRFRDNSEDGLVPDILDLNSAVCGRYVCQLTSKKISDKTNRWRHEA